MLFRNTGRMMQSLMATQSQGRLAMSSKQSGFSGAINHFQTRVCAMRGVESRVVQIEGAYVGLVVASRRQGLLGYFDFDVWLGWCI